MYFCTVKTAILSSRKSLPVQNFSDILTFHPFDSGMIGYFVVAVVLLCVSALVAGSEASFFSLSAKEINTIRKDKHHADRIILRLFEMQDYLLATVLIVSNLLNICIVLICNHLINGLVEFKDSIWEFVIKTIVVTFILLLFGEIMPKIFASHRSLQFARATAVPLLGLKNLFKPFSYLLIHAGGVVTRSLSRRKPDLSMDELSNAVAMTGDQSDEEKQMLSGIVSFVNTEVEEIMKPRVDVVALDEAADYETVKKTIISSGFSRIPVFRGDLDHILGMLYVKDMIPFIGRDASFDWQRHLRKPYFVTEHKKINDLLEEFQLKHVHIAVVVDEYGSTVGLVSLEDILEEIVGEILDESDIEQACYTKLDDRTYLFDGKTSLNDFERFTGLEEDCFAEVRGGAESVAGLMLELKGNFLKEGDGVICRGVEFTVQAVEGRRINKVRVVLPEATPIVPDISRAARTKKK